MEFIKIFNIPKRLELAERRVAEAQHFIDILVGELDDRKNSYKGNPYQSPEAAVKELANKYDGTAQWGNQIAQNIIDLRSVFCVGGGFNITNKYTDLPEKEIDFINSILEDNDIDEEGLINNAILAEIEGRFAAELVVDKNSKDIFIRPISFVETPYKIISDDKNSQRAIKLVFNNSNRTIEEPYFVYKKFGGRAQDLNKVMPKLGLILRQIEDIDKALWDLRAINTLFASPTPAVKVATKRDVEETYDALRKQNWRIGKLLITTGDFDIKASATQGAELVLKEIEVLIKIISANSGIPPHLLGFPDTLSNRATAENLTEMIYLATSKERRIWVGFYEELFQKALAIGVNEFHNNFRTDAIKVSFPLITSAKLKELVDIWAMLYTTGLVDRDEVRAKIPDIKNSDGGNENE